MKKRYVDKKKTYILNEFKRKDDEYSTHFYSHDK